MTFGSKFPGPKESVHSIRTHESLWAAARERADAEGVTMNVVLNELMEGYALGQFDLP